MEGLFNHGEFIPTDEDDESVHNLSDRYKDIIEAFPDEIKGEALPYFVDWLTLNVVLVEIIAYSDENAYTIFETMTTSYNLITTVSIYDCNYCSR